MTSNSAGSRCLVLVVEDDPVLRSLAIDVIDDAGFECLEAANAKDAISILEKRFNIQILFTDIDMPGALNGLELASRVHDRWPKVEIILTSGNAFPRAAEMPTGTSFLPKPYKFAQLIETLQSTMQ